MAGPGDAIAEAARAGEHDRYLAALFAPEPRRRRLIVLAAFAAEVRRIPDVVSQPMLAEVRLQWWRDAIAAGLEGEMSGHPIADALGEIGRECRLPEGLLLGLVDAQATIAAGREFADELELDQHLGKAEGALFELAVEVSVGSDRSAFGTAIAAAGSAYGLARMLRLLAHDSALGRCLVPRSLLDTHATDPHGVATGRSQSRIVEGLAGRARRALHAARVGLESLDRRALPAFLPLAAVPSLLARAGAPSAPSPERFAHVVRIGWAGLRGRV